MADHKQARRVPVTLLLTVATWAATTTALVHYDRALWAAVAGFVCGAFAAGSLFAWERQR